MVFGNTLPISARVPRLCRSRRRGSDFARFPSRCAWVLACWALLLAVADAPALARHSIRKRSAATESKPPAAAKRGSQGSGGRAAAPSGPTIRLEHLTTHDSLALRPGSGRGGFAGGAMKSVSRVLRCHHTGKRHTISPRLVSVLYATARHFHSSHIYVVAGYRAPAVARKKGNPKSAHKRGVACDFRLDGVGIEAIRDYLRGSYHNLGVGYYPNSGFIHVDVGRSHAAYWIDYSRPGEKARYAKGETAKSESLDSAPVATVPAAAESPAATAEVGEESGG